MTKVTFRVVGLLLALRAGKEATVVETAEKYFVVMHWPKNVPCGPMTRYPYKFKTRLEAEQFKQAAERAEPSYEYLIDELEELSKN